MWGIGREVALLYLEGVKSVYENVSASHGMVQRPQLA